jgi:hypothetical protein
MKLANMKKTLLILLSVLALSCTGDESHKQTSKTALNLITGINLRQNIDDVPIQLGNPNVFTDDKFVIYPNSAISTFNIMSAGNENITDVWILPGSPEKIYQQQDFTSILNADLYAEQSIVTHSTISLNSQSSNYIGVNIEALEPGYYRVFVKIGGKIYWDNVYKTSENNEEEINSMMNYWN